MEIQRAEQIANQLISKHLKAPWRFKWNNRKASIGLCSYEDFTIQLSKSWVLCDPEEEVIDTILHEIAHAIAGYKAAHGPEWKKVAKELGVKDIAATRKNIEKRPPFTWAIVFGNEVVKGYYRKPNKSTFDRLSGMYMRGRKEETMGKLEIRKL